MKIMKVGELDVRDLYWALQRQPELWDQNTARTAPEDSPHHGLSDIWARYAALGVDGSQPHESVWYPVAELLPLVPLVERLAAGMEATELGGVLITRIPAGAGCKPHTDPGWHARAYEKVAVQLTSAPGQRFCFDGDDLVTKPGDAYWFDNAHRHWVENPTPYERVTLICCLKTQLFDQFKE